MEAIDVVIPCYIVNEEILEATKETIEALDGRQRLIIIDDASPMGGGYLRSVADVYVRHKSNLGYAAAVNKGIELAKTEYICISNNDVRPSPNWQEVANEVFMNGRTYSCHFRMIDYDVPFKYGNDIKYTGKERWCHGSFFVINTKSLRLFYDEEYKNSYDDWDYFSMVRASGAHQAYTDKACFQHKHGLTTKTLEDYKVQDKKNRALYREKWEQWPEDKFAKDFPEQMSIPYKKGFEL